MKKSKAGWAAVLGVIILAVMVYSYAAGAQVVNATVVKKGMLSKTIMETGYVQSVDQYDIQTQQGGQVVEVPVKVGQLVAKGQTLMVLKNPDLQAAASQAQAQLSSVQGELTLAQQTLTNDQLETKDAQLAYDRQKALQSAGAVSAANIEAANSRLIKAQDTSKSQQEYIVNLQNSIKDYSQMVAENQNITASLIVISPSDGSLLDLPIKIGAVVTAGTTVAQIGTPNSLEVKADLLTDQLGDVEVGQNVYISAPVLGDNVLNGKIREIRPRAYVKTSALGVEQRRVPIFIDLHDPAILKPGYEVEVRVETARRDNALLLPRGSVQSVDLNHFQVMKIQKGWVKISGCDFGIEQPGAGGNCQRPSGR